MEMDERKRRKIRNGITAMSLVLLAGVAVFLFLSAKQQSVNQGAFMGIIIGFLVVYWILLDIVEPRLLHELDDITPERKSAYYKYIFMDAVGYAGLAFFVLSLGEKGSMGILGAVVYVMAVSMKRKAKDEFLGYVPESEQEEDIQEEQAIDQEQGTDMEFLEERPEAQIEEEEQQTGQEMQTEYRDNGDEKPEE